MNESVLWYSYESVNSCVDSAIKSLTGAFQTSSGLVVLGSIRKVQTVSSISKISQHGGISYVFKDSFCKASQNIMHT